MGGTGSGRTPKPTVIKELQGVVESRINRNEPKPTEGMIVPPVNLNEAERDVWDRLAPDLIRSKVLTPWDVDMFVAVCSAVVMMNDARESLGRHGITIVVEDRELANGTIVFKSMPNPALKLWTEATNVLNRFGSKFGLSPADRSRIVTPGERSPEDPADKFL